MKTVILSLALLVAGCGFKNTITLSAFPPSVSWTLEGDAAYQLAMQQHAATQPGVK